MPPILPDHFQQMEMEVEVLVKWKWKRKFWQMEGGKGGLNGFAEIFGIVINDFGKIFGIWDFKAYLFFPKFITI